MKITDLKTYVVGAAWRNLIFIQLETDEGITGCAEATAHNKTQAVLGYLVEAKQRYVLGADPFDIEALFARMFRLDYSYSTGVQSTVLLTIRIFSARDDSHAAFVSWATEACRTVRIAVMALRPAAVT